MFFGATYVSFDTRFAEILATPSMITPYDVCTGRLAATW
jgi:hypothetical protein